jgi:hypothetical protein
MSFDPRFVSGHTASQKVEGGLSRSYWKPAKAQAEETDHGQDIS